MTEVVRKSAAQLNVAQNRYKYKYILQPLLHSFDPSSHTNNNSDSDSRKSSDSIRSKSKSSENCRFECDRIGVNEKTCINIMMPTQTLSSSDIMDSTSANADANINTSTCNSHKSTLSIGRMELIQSIVKRCKQEKINIARKITHCPPTKELECCADCKFWCNIGAKYLSREMFTFSQVKEQQQEEQQQPKQKQQRQTRDSGLNLHVHQKMNAYTKTS